MIFIFYRNKIIKNYNVLLIIISLFIPTMIFGQSSNCNASINVIKNRTVKSVPPEGISYPMNITNNGLEGNTFTLSALNINTSCSNTDGSSSANNVVLTSEFVDSNYNNINEIYLNAGESKSFIVRITIPFGTSVGKWNCTEIIASSKACSNIKTGVVLHSLVMTPNNDN